MSAKPEISCAIIDGISSGREDEDLQDFVVEVEGKEFKCHRLKLSACSGFFHGLLRSGMTESLKQRTKLEGISRETFATIFDIIYTGCDNLTRDNMLNVWLAGDQLQITVVVDRCVNFIMENICLENVFSILEVASQLMHQSITERCEVFLKSNISLETLEIIYLNANWLGLKSILTNIREFIITNYEQVIESKGFRSLHECDLIEIIKSQDLIVSTEDVVVESILSWVRDESRSESQNIGEYRTNEHQSESVVEEQNEKNEDIIQIVKNPVIEAGPSNETPCKKELLTEDRKQCLYRLLSNTRIFLVNPITLKKLSRDSLVMDNKAAREMVMDAALYHSKLYQHGQTLQAAVPRRCSGLENVGVMSNQSGKCYVLTFNSKFLWFVLPQCPFLSRCCRVKLFSYMTDFFAIGDFDYASSLCVFVENYWCEVVKLKYIGWRGVAVNEFIYLINNSIPNHEIKRFNPSLGNASLEKFISFPTLNRIEHVCSDDVFILLFCSEIVNNVAETVVHCLNTWSKTCTRLDNLEGSVKNMVSFRKEKQLYILQANGNLWEVMRDEDKDLHLRLVGAIWRGDYELYGAICFNAILYIYGNTSIQDKLVPISLFSKIVSSGRQGNWSNIVPAVLKKSSLIKGVRREQTFQGYKPRPSPHKLLRRI